MRALRLTVVLGSVCLLSCATEGSGAEAEGAVFAEPGLDGPPLRERSATPSYVRLARVEGYGNPATGELWMRAVPLVDGVEIAEGVGVSEQALGRTPGYCEAAYEADGVANSNPNGTVEFYNQHDATGLPADEASFDVGTCYGRLPVAQQTPFVFSLFGTQGVGCALQHIGNFTGIDYNRVLIDIDVFNGSLDGQGPYGPPITTGTVVTPRGRNAPYQALGLWDFGPLPSGTQGQMTGPHLKNMWIYFKNGAGTDFTWYGFIVGEVFETCGDADDDDCDGVNDNGCGTFGDGALCYANADCKSDYCAAAVIVSGQGEGGGDLGDDVAGRCLAAPTTVDAGGNVSCRVAQGKVECWGASGGGVHNTEPAGDDFVQVSANENHACARRASGAVECWGNDSAGQAQDPAGVFEHVATGGGHSCALIADGTLHCWGEDGDEQSSPPAGSNFTAVDAGGAFSCALRHNGSIACWGDNSNAQATPPGNRVFTSITLGLLHACALDSDGEPSCWGNSADGKLSAPAVSFLSIAAGGHHTCGVLESGALQCWGKNTNGQATPPAGNDYRSVTAGFDHSCAVKMDDSVVCWGLNSAGQTTVPVVTQVPTPPVHTLSSGTDFACAILPDSGKVRCWGRQYHTGLSTHEGTGSDAPDLSLGSDHAISIASGDRHSCAVFEGGDVRCWGDNTNYKTRGATGPQVLVDPGSATPTPLDIGGVAVKVVAGQEHSCVLRQDAQLLCWGGNSVGQLGLGNNTAAVALASTSPVPLGVPVADVCAGASHTCALLQDRTVRCWGMNNTGELGLGTATALGDNEAVTSVAPISVLSSSEIAAGRFVGQIECGSYNTCAVLDDRTVRCWGANGSGALGLGNTVTIGDNELPNTVSAINLGGAFATQVTTAANVTCAHLAGGGVKCWGAASGGTCLGHPAGCGEPVTSPPATTIDFGGGRSVAELGQRSLSGTLCVRLDDGVIKCWNANSYNAAGVNSGATPIAVSTTDTLPMPSMISDLVLGQFAAASSHTSCGNAANEMCAPQSVSIDPLTKKVFVADTANSRVLRFSSIQDLDHGVDAEWVFGQADFGLDTAAVAIDRMNNPAGVFVDHEGTLWVADTGNHRVLMFLDASNVASSPPAADGMFGQVDYTSNIAGNGATEMYTPNAVVMAPTGQLWVADTGNSRVLRFDAATATADDDGGPPSIVLGQAGYDTSTPALGATGMNWPMALALDSSARLWVAELFNNRVVRFDTPYLPASGQPAQRVLGQPDFITGVGTLSQDGMNQPAGLAWSNRGELLVADVNNYRVLTFADVSTNGAAASRVLGQPNFTTATPGYSGGKFAQPMQISVDASGALWVPDTANSRVLMFLP